MSDSLRNPHRDEIADRLHEIAAWMRRCTLAEAYEEGARALDELDAFADQLAAAAFPVLEAPAAVDADWLAPHLANLFYNWDRGIEPPESIKDAAAEVAALVVAVVAERSRDLAEDAADASGPVLVAPPNPPTREEVATELGRTRSIQATFKPQVFHDPEAQALADVDALIARGWLRVTPEEPQP